MKEASPMRRVMDYQTYLAALKRWFHGGQVPGEYYKPAGEFHSLGARGGPHDANGNRLDKNGNVIGRDARFARSRIRPTHTRENRWDPGCGDRASASIASNIH